MKSCSVRVLGSLNWCEGSVSYAGLRRRIYYVSKSAVDSWADNIVSGENIGNITGFRNAPVLKAGKVWSCMDIVADKSQLQSEQQGEKPSKTFKNTLTAVYAGVDVDAAAVAGQILNDDVVVLVQDGDGQWRVIGNNAFPTAVSVAQDNGQGVTGTTATTFTFECTDQTPAPFLTGNTLPNNREDAEEEESSSVA